MNQAEPGLERERPQTHRVQVTPLAAPPLSAIALGLLASTVTARETDTEAVWLLAQRSTLGATGIDPQAGFDWWRRMPPEQDRRLHRLCFALDLSSAECFATALCLVADSELAASRALNWLQAPGRDAHPSLGLICALEQRRNQDAAATLTALLDGPALATGLLMLDCESQSLSEASLRLPLPLLTALIGGVGRWPGVTLRENTGASSSSLHDPLSPGLREQARQRAIALDTPLAVRSGSGTEARTVCAAIAAAAGHRIATVEGEVPAGLGPWLTVHRAMPVLCADALPGERRTVPALPGYEGPVLIATGLDGGWERDGRAVESWVVPMPSVSERIAQWRARGVDETTATALGRSYRLGDTHAEQLAHDAERLRALGGDPMLGRQHVARAARSAERGLLGTLAEPLCEDIEDAALILPEALRQDLHGLVSRCQVRDGLAQGLGAAARARYRPGVRGLFVGASGTGKTLACGWLATRLGLPLYRVDLASVSSKYIGETEKNLGELFARAEHANVVLLFDEADALFGRRTDVKDAHDRYANQQTNYLLQRIENYDGIVLLTSNSRSRFDSAFARRLDVILDFPLPPPDERRALWLAHLGQAHAIAPADLNRIAAACELAGGHIRNVVLTARALSPDRPIERPALEQALAGEYRKLGKPVPPAIAPVRAR